MTEMQGLFQNVFFLKVEAGINSRRFSKYALSPLSDSTPGIALLLAFAKWTRICKVKSVELLLLTPLYFSWDWIFSLIFRLFAFLCYKSMYWKVPFTCFFQVSSLNKCKRSWECWDRYQFGPVSHTTVHWTGWRAVFPTGTCCQPGLGTSVLIPELF